jgi:hypothetical protein
MSHQWHFPQTSAGKIEEANSTLENFKKSGKTAAIREIIQNSLDAQADSEKPSHVTFELESFSKSDFPGSAEFLSYVENLIETKEKITNEHINKIPDLFKTLQDTKVLKITDSNTTGVSPIDLSEIIIKGVGRAKKQKIDAAGGRGMGKAATMLLSEVQIIFYSSKYVDKESTVQNSFMGMVNLESFKFENRTRQAVVYYGERCDDDIQDGLKAIEHNIPDKFRPKDVGLTIFILDYSEDEWEDSIIVSAIENFYAAIHDNKLTIAIGEKIINREQLPALVETYSRDKYKEKYTKHKQRFFRSFPIKDLYRTYIQTNSDKDHNGKIYHGSIMGNKDIELKLIKNEETVKTIHYFNNNGMLIKVEPDKFTNASVTINASGELAGFLKKMETTEHTDWFPLQLASGGTVAVKEGTRVLAKIDDFISQTLEAQNEFNEGDEMTLDWTADLLPQIDNADNNNSDKEEDELKNIAEPITLKPLTKKSPFDTGREEALINPDEGETDGGRKKRKRKTKLGELSEDGKKGFINKKSVLNKKRVIRSNNNQLTIILQSKEEKDCWISIKAITEDNQEHLLTINNASVDAITCSYNLEKTKIGPIALKKDINTRLTVELTDNYPMALEIASFEFQLPIK